MVIKEIEGAAVVLELDVVAASGCRKISLDELGMAVVAECFEF